MDSRVGTPQQVTDAITYHGEGPVWSESWGGLRFVDMFAGDLLTLGADGSLRRLHVGPLAAFVRPRRQGGYVVGLERGLGLADGPDAAPVPLPQMWTDTAIRMNEGGCDPAGNLYAGSMAWEKNPGAGSFYRVTPDGAVEVVEPAVTISNGIDCSPDGTRVYYNDTAPAAPTSSTPATGGSQPPRPSTSATDGDHPDGLCVDSAGNVWVALYGAGRVRCYSPAGQVLHEVELPARRSPPAPSAARTCATST